MFDLEKEIAIYLQRRLPGCKITVAVPPASEDVFQYLVDRIYDSFEDDAETKANNQLVGLSSVARTNRTKQYRNFLSLFATYFGDNYYAKCELLVDSDPNGFIILGPELYDVGIINEVIGAAWSKFEGPQAFRPRAAGGVRRRRSVPWPFARVQSR